MREDREEGRIDWRDKELSFAPAEPEAPVVFLYNC